MSNNDIIGIGTGLLHQRFGECIRQVRGDVLGESRARRTVRLHTHRIDHRVRTTTVRQLAYHLGKIIFVLAKIDHLDSACQRSRLESDAVS